MSTAKKPLKIAQKLIQQIWKLSRAITKKLMSFLLRGLFVFGRRSPRFASSGFILPTVVMVLLVVALLTTAIVMRSFDRTKNVSNVRINQRVLAATQPAIDRAEAKIKALLADPTLPRSTPTDQALYQTMTDKLPKYTLGDEKPLRLVYDFNGGGIDESGTLDNNEALKTAWRFPIDTDNNGKFDSYSLYGVYFRNPSRTATRARTPLEARTPPMDNGESNGCAAGANTSASLVGASGWYKTSDGNLKKSFYVFATTVPITNPSDPSNYEAYKGNKGFAALEFQQDQARIPLTNNAVVYDDDLEIAPGAGIRLNGRIMTNSNLFIGKRFDDAPVEFYQVSSTESCFYTAENGKITVGGNVKLGTLNPGKTVTAPTVDLFKPNAEPDHPTFDNSSVTNTEIETSYNSEAYVQRIDYLIQEFGTGTLPSDVQEAVNAGTDQRKALENYFKARTRRVPYAEVPQGGDALAGADVLQGSGDTLRPQKEWMYPVDPDNGTVNNSLALAMTEPPATNPDNLDLSVDGENELGDRIIVGNGLPATWWDQTDFVDFYDKEPQDVDGTANSVFWSDPGSDVDRTRMTQFIPLADLGDTDRNGFWEKSAAEAPKQALDGVGGLRVVTGAGIYDPDNSFLLPRPTTPIADDFSTTEDESAAGFKVVFPDSMPMWEDTNNNGEPNISPADDKRGDLIMRATAVYHYKYSEYPNAGGTAQKPIACVSSYYNPSTSVTAKNRETLPDGTATPWNSDPNGLSNNGITYAVPSEAETPGASIATGSSTPEGVFDSPAPEPPIPPGDLRAKLNYQANLIFPDGRFANEPLRTALKNLDGGALTLADQSALASAVCALKIISGDISPVDTAIPHGAIYETAFLDARQVKALETEAPAKNFSAPPAVTTDYDLSLVERQPLEVRATVLDLDQLRKKAVTGTSVVPGTEFLLPDSGIIYATRDDALLDLSAPGDDPPPTAAPATLEEAKKRTDTRKLNSPVDFSLDPTRRPDGIMVINGSILARQDDDNNYKETEKGLILVSNLPVYVKADQYGFNLHQSSAGATTRLEEFETALASNFSNFYGNTSGRNEDDLQPLFACRKGQPGLPDCNPGDLWRPATILADSVTLLSNNFRQGFRNEGDYDLRKNVDNLNNNLRFEGYDFVAGGGLSNDILGEASPRNFDMNEDGSTTNTIEEVLGIDLNGDGDLDEADVSEADITIAAARRLNGFFDNNYVTSANSFNASNYPDADPDTTGDQGSSYLNNFVTPIQRRATFREYVMEICRKPLVEQCQPQDWVVGLDYEVGNEGVLTDTEKNVKAWQLLTYTENNANAVYRYQLGAGTTAKPALVPADRRYPRRVAFLRMPDNDGTHPSKLVLDNNRRPIPLGIEDVGGALRVNYFPYDDFTIDFTSTELTSLGSALEYDGVTPFTRSSTLFTGGQPREVDNALWFRTSSTPTDPTTGADYGVNAAYRLFYKTKLAVTALGTGVKFGTTQQPLLVPVLQLHVPTAAPTDGNTLPPPAGNSGVSGTWMQRPAETTFNLIIVSGDSPNRDATATTPADYNGGMPNFPGFLENWKDVPARISGSFIQFKRSAYATAPYLPIADNTGTEPIFDYPKAGILPESNDGKSPYYVAPNREWGFDVGLLSQLPDLFSQKITTPSPGEPNRFYRELSRSDEWVKTLLCSGVTDNDKYAVESTERPNDYCQDIGAASVFSD